MVVRWIVLSLVATLAAGVYAVYVGALAVPARYNPWAPLDVEAAPDWLTDIRLARTRRDPALCAAALARTGMRYDAVPDRETAYCAAPSMPTPKRCGCIAHDAKSSSLSE